MLDRRELLMMAMAAAWTGTASGGQPEPGAAPAAALARGDGELVYVGRDPVRIKVNPPHARGRFGMITQDVSPGTVIPVHAHDLEDEIIFIASGTGDATLGEKTFPLAPGSTLYVPQGTWHGGRNTGSETMLWVAIYSPSGFENYFREIGRGALDEPPRMLTPEQRRERDAKYGIRYR